jgi:hypothetical protein
MEQKDVLVVGQIKQKISILIQIPDSSNNTKKSFNLNSNVKYVERRIRDKCKLEGGGLEV